MAYFITQPRILYVMQIADKKHQDLVKIGDIFVSEDEFREYSQAGMLEELVTEKLKEKSWAKNLNFKIIYAVDTTFDSFEGKRTFTAGQIIDILSNSGYDPDYKATYHKEKADIWIPVRLEKVKIAIEAAKQGHKTIEGKPTPPPKPIRFRPEQKQAIDEAIKRFSTKTGKKFLWNAKMRFGKTLSALEVVRQLGEKDEKNPERPLVKTVLIVTHRPVVDDGWHTDFNKIFYDKLDKYSYGSRNAEGYGAEGDFRSLIREVKRDEKRLVFFVSMQYLRLSNLVGGENEDPVKREIMNYDWDMVVVDEAHEGTKTQRGENVIKKLKKDKTLMLSLSGTPFNLYDEFKDEEIYTWDYVKEQTAKAKWEDEHFGDPNPYAELPHMNIFTFDLSKILKDNEDEFSEFKFNEFFRTWTGELKKDGQKMPSDDYKGKFIHETAVNDFLNLLVNAKEGTNYPFSTEEFRKKFRHTFWMVPGVKEAKALENLLSQHPIFKRFKVVNVAGDGNIEDPDNSALHEVEDAIAKNKYTITLSCGKLTTGVSVPQWTAVLYMKGSEMTTAATYMQTIFRVQTHAIVDGEQKRECYVFDFAPSRALRVVAETAKYAVRAKGSGGMNLVKGSQEEEENELGEFLKFCPVISLDSGAMVKYEASKLFAQLKDVYVARAVQSGYADNSLYSADSIIHLDEEGLAALSNISSHIGSMPNLPNPDKINVGNKPMTDEEKELAKKAEKKKREKQELTEAEKEALDKKKKERDEKKARISVLRGISIRIPLLVYGAEIVEGHEDEELSIENFTKLVDQQSWDEFMPNGVTKSDFNKIRKSYDPVVFREAAKRIRSLTRAADSMDVEERIERIATIFSYFHNPDKETVLTPWRVVNMHMADTLGGWCFFNKDYSAPNVEIRKENGNELEIRWPRWVNQGEVTKEIFKNKDARLLEINSKTGLYPLYLTYSLYREWKPEYLKHDLIEKAERDDKVIWDSILKDNLFVVCKTPMARAITRRTLVGFRKHDDGSQIQVNAVCPEWELSKKELIKKNILKNPDKKEIREDEKYKSDLVTVLRFNPSLFEKDVVDPAWWERGGREPGKKDKTVNIKLDKEIFKDMIKFNAVVGNPPYQEMDGGNRNSASPIYDRFVLASKYITNNYVSMIMPARWIVGGRELGDFREQMFTDGTMSIFYDFIRSIDCFPHTRIGGGVCYFLIDKKKTDINVNFINREIDKEDIIENRKPLDFGLDFVVRNNFLYSIVAKVRKKENIYLSDKAWSQKPFGFRTNFLDFTDSGEIKLYTKQSKSGIGYVKFNQIEKNADKVPEWQLVTSRSTSVPEEDNGQVLRMSQTFIVEPNAVATESYVVIYSSKEKEEADNVFKYLKTKFFRQLCQILIVSPDVSQKTFCLVPLQDFTKHSDIDWGKSVTEIDRQLYKKYGLEKPEIDFIESMIKPME